MEKEKYYNLVPSIGNSYGYGWRKIFGKSFGILLLTVIIVGILGGAINANAKFDSGSFNNLIFIFPLITLGLAYAFMFMPIIKYGEKYMFLQVMRDEEADLKSLIDGFKNKYFNIVLSNLIVFALVMFGFILLIIPGIIAACRLVFVPYLVMDKDLDPMKAIEKSWELTRGHGWEILGMAIISVFVFFAGVLAFIVGTVISIMWIHAAFATFYQSVLNEKEGENPIPILGVNEV